MTTKTDPSNCRMGDVVKSIKRNLNFRFQMISIRLYRWFENFEVIELVKQSKRSNADKVTSVSGGFVATFFKIFCADFCEDFFLFEDFFWDFLQISTRDFVVPILFRNFCQDWRDFRCDLSNFAS